MESCLTRKKIYHSAFTSILFSPLTCHNVPCHHMLFRWKICYNHQKCNKIHGIFLLFVYFLRHEATSIFYLSFFSFRQARNIPCPDTSTVEYNVCPLMVYITPSLYICVPLWCAFHPDVVLHNVAFANRLSYRHRVISGFKAYIRGLENSVASS